jgi:hypothetical protein
MMFGPGFADPGGGVAKLPEVGEDACALGVNRSMNREV